MDFLKTQAFAKAMLLLLGTNKTEVKCRFCVCASWQNSGILEFQVWGSTICLTFGNFFYDPFGQEFEDNSASSQVFWLLKESELTPSNANILDGRYAVFGYVTENEDFLADVKVGDVIESMQVVSGLENLVNPSYKIAG